MVPHGLNYYMKGAFASNVRPEASEEILKRVIDFTSKLGAQAMFIFEYIPTKKTMSFPMDSTAYIRGDLIGTLCFFSWKPEEDEVGKLETIRAAANEISSILIKAEDKLPDEKNTGYGNYGQ
jgi:hypothetical protein